MLAYDYFSHGTKQQAYRAKRGVTTHPRLVFFFALPEKVKNMIWNRSTTLAMAEDKCTACGGTGLRPHVRQSTPDSPCKCVLRGIFRVCYARFKDCASQAGDTRLTGNTWSRPNEEYVADFVTLAKRALYGTVEKYVFKYHILYGADWTLCIRQLGKRGIEIDRGTFFHAVYRVQEKLGKAFSETKPYGLFPLDEYFGGSFRAEDENPVPPTPAVASGRPALCPPVNALPKAA